MPPPGPSGIDNQGQAWLSASEACALLGVKRDTLYAYASRGLVRRSGDAPKRRGYARDDLLRLKARSEARAGDGPVAAGALRWGEAVLETSISLITPEGPAYRGVPFRDFLARGARFEHVAEHLWAVEPGAAPWPPLSVGARAIIAGLPRDTTCLKSMLATAALLCAAAPEADPFAEARSLIRALAASVGVPYGRAPLEPRDEPIAATCLRALGCDPTLTMCAVVDRALVTMAEHELNPSTFAARVAASVGADTSACVVAALATMTGPAHGGESDRLDLLLERSERGPTSVAATLDACAGRIPGFGHTLYPKGDPRATALLEGAPAVGALLALIEALPDRPNVDAGLVAFRRAWGLPRGAASALFALGRTAGWVAHALEQRATGVVLRPRARYRSDASTDR